MYHGYDCGDNLQGYRHNHNHGGWTCSGINTTCPYIETTMAGMKKFVDKEVPGMKLWMTELCYALEDGDYPSPPKCPTLPRYDFEDAMQWGYMIFGDFGTVGASGWIYWNMILDTNGGPWLTSPEHNDPDPNIQHPVIIVDIEAQKYYLTGLYYMMAHFSHFLEPLVTYRVDLQGQLPSNLKAIAFEHNRRVVVVIMNDSQENRNVSISFGNQFAEVPLTPVSVTTLEFYFEVTNEEISYLTFGNLKK